MDIDKSQSPMIINGNLYDLLWLYIKKKSNRKSWIYSYIFTYLCTYDMIISNLFEKNPLPNFETIEYLYERQNNMKNCMFAY